MNGNKITAMRPLRVIIAGAGTGGHLFPGIAIAEALDRAAGQLEILFITTGRQVETAVFDRYGYAHKKISASGIKGKGPGQKLAAMARLVAGLVQCLKIVKGFSPMAVVGMGGYASAPVIMGARFFRVPCAICEQNRIAGLTNRVLSRFADRIYVSFPDTKFSGGASKTVHTGNPVRKDILGHGKAHGGDTKSKFTTLILGGSQGAHGVNTAIMDALLFLEEKERYFFIHQTGGIDAGIVKQAYEKCGIAAEVKPFFDDMGAKYAKADLVICRAGASTIAELCSMELPAFFIPLPHAADNHQVLNAQYVVASGGAEMIEQKDITGKLVAERIGFYAANAGLLLKMRASMAKIAKTNAAELIVSDIMKNLISGRSGMK